MYLHTRSYAAFAATLLASSAFAQTSFPETESNSQKTTANPVVGIVAGDSITGITTGTLTTLGDTTNLSADTFRVKTGALPIGLYQHKLTLTSTTVGHTGTIRGLDQTGTAGVGGVAGTTDLAIQTSVTTSTPPRFNLWYGFGKQEEIYYGVTGTATTTAPYVATLTTTAITPNVIAQAFESANPITISTVGQTFLDTEILLYDSTFTPVPGGLNDNQYPVFSSQSTLTRTLPAGTYYAAVSTFELCSNQLTANDDNYVLGFLTDFPDCVVLSSSATTNDYDFIVTGSNGTLLQANQLPLGDPFRVTWWQITLAPGAPPIFQPPPANDNCAGATSVGVGAFSGTMLGATHDGVASCDLGGAASKDVWYSHTNTSANPRILAATTCGTTGVNDTVLSIYSGCGGAELACSDDCGGTPCAAPTSCISGLALAPSQTVWIRVSDKGLGSTSGAFTLNLSETAPPPPNDSCATPIALSGVGVFAVDNTGATTGTEGQTEALCLAFGFNVVRQDVWYTWTATNSGSVELTTCGLLAVGSQDTKIGVYNGAGCPTASAIACNDDDPAFCGNFATKLTFTAVCGNTYTFQVGMYGGTAAFYQGGLRLTPAGAACATPSTPFCVGDTAALCPCSGAGGSGTPNPGTAGHGCGNSVFPGGALLTTSGIAANNAGDTLVLTVSDIPGPTLFFQGTAGLASVVNFNDGRFCVASGIIRLGIVFPTAGVASYPGGLTPNPIHIAGSPVLGGGTPGVDDRHYQAWYRDIPVFCNPQGHNMSNAVSLTWTP